ncbi:MAG: hypothetical protein KDI06_20840 [Calditrichaeota bacterium]|nr:hypothetical protein [Calditrichota bacterium]HQU71375.1 DUF5668 domain-containing protein [Calditrichia bacterium]
MNTTQKTGLGTSLIIGVVLIGLGVLFLLDNLFNIDLFFDLMDLWPLILIFLGGTRLINGEGQSTFVSWLLIGIGTLFLLNNFNIIYIEEVWEMWPLVLILIGIRIIYQHTAADKIPDSHSERADSIDSNRIKSGTVFGGRTLRINSNSFEGGEISNVFGGTELHFEDSRLAPGGAILYLTAVFGGVEMYVPPDWQVVIKGTPIFGGIEDSRQRIPERNAPEDPVLEIRGTVLFGGVEIKTGFSKG